MRVPVTMPKLGYDVDTGRLASWLKGVGDKVIRGEAIAEVETDKVTVEMESLSTGTLVEIVHEAATGVDIAVGDVIAYLDEAV